MGKLQDIPSFWQESLYYSMFSLARSCTSLSEGPGKRHCWVLYIPLGKLAVTSVWFYRKKSKSCKISPFILILIYVLATDMWTAVRVMCSQVTVMGFVCVFACFVKRETCQEDLWECEPSLQMASYLFGGNHLMEQASEVHTADPKVIPVDMERATEGWAMLQCCKSDKTRKQEN